MLLLAAIQSAEKFLRRRVLAGAHTPPRSTCAMEERASEGESSAGAGSEEARMLHCARLAHARSACCAVCREALRMDPPAKRSHHSAAVSSACPVRAPRADAAPVCPLSRHAPACPAVLRVRARDRRRSTAVGQAVQRASPRLTERDITCARSTGMSSATRQLRLLLRPPCPRLPRRCRCSAVRRAAATS